MNLRAGIRNAVAKGWLTQEQADEILSPPEMDEQ